MSIIRDTIELCSLFGPSGFEDEVREHIAKKAEGLCDSMHTDPVGNLICRVKGASNRYTLMIEAHMDEVGFMIREIGGDGLLRFGTVGGIDPRVMAGKRVIVRGHDKDDIHGVITSKPIHLKSPEERGSVTKTDAMYIDIGASNKEDAEKYVEVGDCVVFDSPAVELGQYKVKAKAIDDRLGCAMMLRAMARLKEEKVRLPYDVVFCFGVREEVGFSGAKPSTFAINPTHAIAIESTAVSDTEGTAEHLRVADQGKGGALSLADLGTLYNREMIKWATDVAAERCIPLQTKRYISGSNNSRHISQSRAGVKVLALSAPTRYIHSPACVVDRRDAQAMDKLLFELILNYERLTEER